MRLNLTATINIFVTTRVSPSILSRYAATPQGETIELCHTGYGLTTFGASVL